MSEIHSKMNRAMTVEQFTQVVDAILEGKYSWACVLILRYAGYNPLHYIPYRTYNRLTKENELNRDRSRNGNTNIAIVPINKSAKTSTGEALHEIKDLSCLEVLHDSQMVEEYRIKGGDRLSWQSQCHFAFKAVGATALQKLKGVKVLN